MGAATTKWGELGDWNVSGVDDFSHAFSQDRDATGGTQVANSNPKAATFVGTAMSKWTTTSATSLEGTFYKASEMNANLSLWKVDKVNTLQRTFGSAYKFAGVGLDSWITASVTDMSYTFPGARKMNSDLSGWIVNKVFTMRKMFAYTETFVGTGLGSWNTTSVKSLQETFRSAKAFVGTGLSSWDTTSVTSLAETFKFAIKFNTDLHSFDVSGTAVMTGGVAAREPRGGLGVEGQVVIHIAINNAEILTVY